MPTVPLRNCRNNNFHRKGDNQDLLLEPTKQPHKSSSEVIELELKWGEGMTKCGCKNKYSWASQPKVLRDKKNGKSNGKPEDKKAEKIFKETPSCERFKNVMVDKRVCRGSNFAQALMDDVDPFDKAANLRRRKLITSVVSRHPRNIIGTPPPVKGRRHEVIQTDKYLEELLTHPTEFSVNTQTDLYLERPPEPPYKPAKVGIDAATEIGDGELFHFDAEAQPIIEILVDSCIEQSMLEVAHEKELEEIRKKQDEYLAKREAELAELRRLEAEEMRLQAEKERRLRQEKIAKEIDEEVQKGVTAAKLLQGHIAGILPEVLENLEPATDAAKKEQLMKSICPWLTKQVAEEVGQIVDSREILTVIIHEIIKQRAEIYGGYSDELPEPLIKSGEECTECETEDEKTVQPSTESCKESTDENDGCPPGV